MAEDTSSQLEMEVSLEEPEVAHGTSSPGRVAREDRARARRDVQKK